MRVAHQMFSADEGHKATVVADKCDPCEVDKPGERIVVWVDRDSGGDGFSLYFWDGIDQALDFFCAGITAVKKLQPPAPDDLALIGESLREGEIIVTEALARGEHDKARVATTREQFIANLRDAASQGDLKCKNWDVEGLLRDAAAMLEMEASNV